MFTNLIWITIVLFYHKYTVPGTTFYKKNHIAQNNAFFLFLVKCCRPTSLQVLLIFPLLLPCSTQWIPTKGDVYREATFYVSEHVNCCNVRIWGFENPQITRELNHGTPKINVWCGLMQDRVIGSVFFYEKSITGTIYYMLNSNYFLQVEDLQPTVMFQHDGAPPHWFNDVR